MRFVFFSLAVLLSPSIGAQTTSFPVKTSFNLGDSKTYAVNEFFKIDHLFLNIHSNVQSTVLFQVIDTADGGSWISYRVNTNLVKSENNRSAYIIALLMDQLQLLIYAKNGHLQLDSASYIANKTRASAVLDSLAPHQIQGKADSQLLSYMRNQLRSDEGLGMLLSPLLAFEVYYRSGAYTKFRITSEGRAENILFKPLFPGSISSQWKSTSRDGTATLNFTFTGHPVYAGQYYRTIYDPILDANHIKRGRFFYPPEMRHVVDYTFTVQANHSFPRTIRRKTVSEFLFRTVAKMEMKEIPD